MLKVIVLILLMLMLTGCKGEDKAAVPVTKADDLEPDEIPVAETQFTPLSKVMTKESFPEEITLTFYAEPVKISSDDYAKLNGVVLGKANLALFSLGSTSVMCEIGEKIGDYVLVKVDKDAVVLRRCDETE